MVGFPCFSTRHLNVFRSARSMEFVHNHKPTTAAVVNALLDGTDPNATLNALGVHLTPVIITVHVLIHQQELGFAFVW